MKQQFIERLKQLAARDTIFDGNENPVIDDYAGGNVDDAYFRGQSDGETDLARDVLEELRPQLSPPPSGAKLKHWLLRDTTRKIVTRHESDVLSIKHDDDGLFRFREEGEQWHQFALSAEDSIEMLQEAIDWIRSKSTIANKQS